MKKPKLLLLGVDGAMPSYIKAKIAEGKLPDYKRLMEKGYGFGAEGDWKVAGKLSLHITVQTQKLKDFGKLQPAKATNLSF